MAIIGDERAALSSAARPRQPGLDRRAAPLGRRQPRFRRGHRRRLDRRRCGVGRDGRRAGSPPRAPAAGDDRTAVAAGAERQLLVPVPALPAPALATLLAELSARRRDAELATQGRHDHRPAARPCASCSATLDRVAPADAAVLITGESGTGKELVARALHELGAARGRAVRRHQLRRDPRDAARERAVRPRARRLHRRRRSAAAACSRRRDGGTLFLDEIGELPLACSRSCCACSRRARCTRRRLERDAQIDVRLVAATNRDLDDEVGGRPLPRGSLLPPARLQPEHSAAARSPRGRPAAGLAPPRASWRRAIGATTPVISKPALEKLCATAGRQRPRAGERARARDGAGAAGRADRRPAHPSADDEAPPMRAIATRAIPSRRSTTASSCAPPPATSASSPSWPSARARRSTRRCGGSTSSLPPFARSTTRPRAAPEVWGPGDSVPIST